MGDTNLNEAKELPQVDIHLPAEPLRRYVTFYYFVTAAGPVSDFLYPEWGNIRFTLSGEWQLVTGDVESGPLGDTLFGPTDRCSRVVSSGARIAGFGLTPLGWHRLIGGNAGELANRAVPLGDSFGRIGRRTAAILAGATSDAAGVAWFDALLTARLADRLSDDPLVTTIDRVLRNRPRHIADFAAAAGVSTRTLHRVCLRSFGFAPKRLLRRQRFLDTLGHVRTAVGDPLREALDPDYFDQAHFYRDFRTFMGMTPRAYFSASRALMARAAAAQAAAGVTLSFKLPLG